MRSLLKKASLPSSSSAILSPSHLPAWSKHRLRFCHALGTELGDGKDKEVYDAYSVPSKRLQCGRRQKTNSCNKKTKIRLFERPEGASRDHAELGCLEKAT